MAECMNSAQTRRYGTVDWHSLLNRLTYKPDSEFSLRTNPHMLMLTQRLPDATGRANGLVRVSLTADLPPYPVDLDDAMAIIGDLCQRAEQHEVDEWLRLDGVQVVEPHPNG